MVFHPDPPQIGHTLVALLTAGHLALEKLFSDCTPPLPRAQPGKTAPQAGRIAAFPHLARVFRVFLC